MGMTRDEAEAILRQQGGTADLEGFLKFYEASVDCVGME